MNTKTRRRLAVLFSVPLAFCLVFFFANQTSEQRETRLLRIQRLATSIRQVRTLAREAESGERGFVLTGEDRYLSPLKNSTDIANAEIRNALTQAEQLPRYKAELETLGRLVRKRIQQANAAVAEQRMRGVQGVVRESNFGESEDTMDLIRKRTAALTSRLNAEESSILKEQGTFSRLSFVFFAVGSLLMSGVIIWLYNALLKYLYERDIANEQLRAANANLEARIEERTHDLTQANEELQQFAYVASHDLQEPLRTITSFSQLLAVRYQGRLDEDADEFIGYIVTASRRMTDLINGLLSLVRLRKAGQPNTPVPFEALLEHAEANLQALIRENEARIQHGPLPVLTVDGVQFAQVLQNLISNAIKYRSEQPPLIRVDARKEDGEWIFSVSDNGRGFDPQFAERIFGLFQRLNSREVDGTGMGLAIARKIVERHGGKMWAKSAEAVGSTFFFGLPVNLEQANSTSRRELA